MRNRCSHGPQLDNVAPHVLFDSDMSRPKDEHHPPEEIRAYIDRYMPGFAKDISIGFVSGHYRVCVTDREHVVHIIKIHPKEIDADHEEYLKTKARTATPKTRIQNSLDRARKTAAAFKAKLGRGKEHDLERER
jgi:hypothetical protein